jgi:GcrA cell cycle regulator
MEMTNWAPEHSDALRNYVAKGMSFSKIARAINARFNTSYSRNAAIGRAKRMGLAGLDRPGASARPQISRLGDPRAESKVPKFRWPPKPVFEDVKPVKLRCVEIEPRHLALIELAWGECRYPYGGDAEGEPITFCGHPRRPGSSYCTPHFRLSRNPDLPSAAARSTASLRMVDAA